MTELMKRIVENDIQTLFEDKTLILDKKRMYRSYTMTKGHRHTIGFEVDGNNVYYNLLITEGSIEE